jgi:hypothetical protein
VSPGLGAGGRSRFFGGVSLRPRFFGGVWLRATAVAACCDRVGGISTPLPSFCALRRSAGDGHRCRHRYMYIAGPIRCSDSGPARARKAACGRRAGGAPRLFWYCSRAVAPTFAFGCTPIRRASATLQLPLHQCLDAPGMRASMERPALVRRAGGGARGGIGGCSSKCSREQAHMDQCANLGSTT